MINSKIYYLHKLLQKTEYGLYSKVVTNYIKLISYDPDIIEKLKSLKFMNDFIIKIVINFEDAGAYMLHIFQETDTNEKSIEKKVELEFDKIFEKYKDQIDFLYCIDKKTIVIESNNLDLIREICIDLKNFNYCNVGNKHIFEYCLNI